MRYVLSFFLIFATMAASAAEPLVMRGVVLLQPDAVLRERVPDIAAFGSYIEQIETAAAAPVSLNRTHDPAGGFLVIAIKPGKQSKAWLDVDPVLQPDLAKSIISRARAVPPPEVEGGPVVFAIRFSVWGGAIPDRSLPDPPEWRDAAKKAGGTLEMGAFVERIWHEQP